MGLIFSRFYEKPSTRDTLEKIEQEIQSIEERRWDKIKREQFVVQILSFIPVTILIVTICILIYPSDSSWRDKLLLCVPIIILNLIFWSLRKVVQWYSRWSLDKEEQRMRKLQKEKKRILEMVCETESYRVATELLEKYDPKQLRRREKTAPERPSSPLNTTLTKISASPIRSPPQQNQHQQLQSPLSVHNQSLNYTLQPQPTVPAPPPPTPMPAPKPNIISAPSTNLQNTSINTTVATSSVQGRPVRPILSKDRTLFERVVDWVVADGPDNRFALICRYCYGHNGMSLAEEYETINFRCCYCYNLNTATNKRHQIHDQLQPEREKSDQASKTTSETDKKAEQQGNQTSDKEKQKANNKQSDDNPVSINANNKINNNNNKKSKSHERATKNEEPETTCDNSVDSPKEGTADVSELST